MEPEENSDNNNLLNPLREALPEEHSDQAFALMTRLEAEAEKAKESGVSLIYFITERSEGDHVMTSSGGCVPPEEALCFPLLGQIRSTVMRCFGIPGLLVLMGVFGQPATEEEEEE